MTHPSDDVGACINELYFIWGYYGTQYSVRL